MTQKLGPLKPSYKKLFENLREKRKLKKKIKKLDEDNKLLAELFLNMPISPPKKKITYIFHHDPGHGWLQVPVSKLVELGITDKITSYSYITKDLSYAFLEEDCDIQTFYNALGKRPDSAEKYHDEFDRTNLMNYDKILFEVI